MPVPVPHISKPVAHPVRKQPHLHESDLKPSVFRTLTLTLPDSPTGPPPSFGTREEWISSLPPWRRSKPRRIWEDDTRFSAVRTQQHFQEGLTAAENASVIKGTRAQACIPPLFTLLENRRVAPSESSGNGVDADDELSSDSSVMDRSPFDNESQWSASSPLGSMDDIDMEQRSQVDAVDNYATGSDVNRPVYKRGSFTPIFEDDSPRRDVASSPLGPVTPFGEFVDRAVAAAPACPTSDAYPCPHEDKPCGVPELPCQSLEVPKEPALPEPVVTPSASAAYKKLAEPLSDWVSNYIWKVCTTGMSLPSTFSRPLDGPIKQRPSSPPNYLADSVHSLLLSTLLQPSAIFLAVWYIVRLPVYFDAGNLGEECVKEMLFRAELLGDTEPTLDRDAMEANAPFRLILLGCMLANKWLDDHTFSNKTWHTISNVPIQSLNKLESLALDIFSYDLSVPSHTWSQWLAHVIAYHVSLSPPSHRQPISRPSSNPHSIIRRTIEELIQAPVDSTLSPGGSKPEPVFLGLEERKRQKEQTLCIDIDLDADGPLREEYLPRRRVSGASSILSIDSSTCVGQRFQSERRTADHLPPPAKWSPAGDEPILREKNGAKGNYIAVQPQPPRNSLMPLSFTSLPYHQIPNGGFQGWPATDDCHLVKPPPAGRVYDAGHPPILHAYADSMSHPAAHSRSQSFSFEQENMQPINHHRTQSQSQFEYRCSDIRTTEFSPASRTAAQWTEPRGYPCPYVSALGPYAGIGPQSTWLRT